MLKRIFSVIVLCLFLMPVFIVHADLIVEPENEFYERYAGQIILLERSFAANGKSGSVAIKKEPGAKTDFADIKNGEVLYIQFSCLYDGVYWGYTPLYTGWIRLDQMLVLYDYVTFAEDHLDQFYTYSGSYEKIKENNSAVAWPWPGADAPLWTFEDLDTENFQVSYAYKDEEGREWGFVTYLYGSRNLWICLSDPLNLEIAAFNPAKEPAIWVSDTIHIDINQYAQEKETPAIILIVVLVVTLVAGTAALIRIFWSPNKSKPEAKNND